MTLYKWLQASGSNANADSTINWAEGQAPSTVNDSARAMMAATAKYRDDIAGAIVTAGTSTAYTASSYEVFDTLAHLNGQVIAFTPHVTNGATVTLNVDSLGAKPLRTSPNVELQSGVLIQGTPYIAIYNNSDAAFYLRGVGPQPGIPLGASIDYWGTSAPSTFFALAYGQGLSTTAYAPLFALVGYTYGGTGATFNLPDLRGRVVAGKDDMGGSAAIRIGTVATDSTTITGTTLGSAGGSATHALNTGEMPTHSHANTLSDPGHSHVVGFEPSGSGATAGISASGDPQYVHSASTVHTQSATTGITITNANVGSGSAHAILQPTIIGNKLIRVV